MLLLALMKLFPSSTTICSCKLQMMHFKGFKFLKQNEIYFFSKLFLNILVLRFFSDRFLIYFMRQEYVHKQYKKPQLNIKTVKLVGVCNEFYLLSSIYFIKIFLYIVIFQCACLKKSGVLYTINLFQKGLQQDVITKTYLATIKNAVMTAIKLQFVFLVVTH